MRGDVCALPVADAEHQPGALASSSVAKAGGCKHVTACAERGARSHHDLRVFGRTPGRVPRVRPDRAEQSDRSPFGQLGPDD
jgi:hypothetical protein